jgi:hypothetical protein
MCGVCVWDSHVHACMAHTHTHTQSHAQACLCRGSGNFLLVTIQTTRFTLKIVSCPCHVLQQPLFPYIAPTDWSFQSEHSFHCKIPTESLYIMYINFSLHRVSNSGACECSNKPLGTIHVGNILNTWRPVSLSGKIVPWSLVS